MSEAEWHILTVTRGGTVSLLKNLTEDVARQAMQRLGNGNVFYGGDPWNVERRVVEERRRRKNPEQQGHWIGGWQTCSDGDLNRVECFGPEGRKLEVWPKPADFDERLAAAMAELDLEFPPAPAEVPA